MSERENNQETLESLLLQRPESIPQLIDSMSFEVYDSLKLAVEIGKWADGRRLAPEQLDFCLQAVILYEAKHLQEQDRIGFDLSASCKSKNNNAKDPNAAEPLTLKGNNGSQA